VSSVLLDEAETFLLGGEDMVVLGIDLLLGLAVVRSIGVLVGSGVFVLILINLK
jgi:hypothetical protein